MINYWVNSEKAPTFLEWLSKSWDTCPRELYALAMKTGKYGDYNKWMEYLRRRYREEMEVRRALIESNPFTQKKEDNSNGCNVSGK